MLSSIRFALGFSVVLLACGDDASEGTGGMSTSGSGGDGGSGGSGASGSGGAGGGCEGGGANEGGGVAECRALASEAVRVGFDVATPASGTHSIVAVTATSLQIAGETLLWIGPDLTTRFAVGETITLGRAGEWDFVEGATTRLATLNLNAVGHLGFLQPPFGPVLASGDAPQCTFEVPSNCDACKSDGVALYGLSASMGDAVQSVAMGRTQSLDGWDITNGSAIQTSGLANSSGDCQGEDFFSVALTVIGAAAPL